MTPDQRRVLRAHLLSSGIAGATATTRENTVSNAEKLAAGDPDKALGLGARGKDARAVMEAVAALCGCSPSLEERDGPGVIDPDLVLDAIERLGERLARAAKRGERMLLATGHPTGLLPMYQVVARALAARGAKLETPLEDVRLEAPEGQRRRRRVRYLDGVAVLNADVDLIHTHESWQMDALLDAIEPPDLVLADHGWAGAAIARGVEVACFTDVNDPAIAVAKADGLVEIVVPCDDNLPPVVYEPVRDYLVALVG
ncbi:MAG: phosphatase [Actinomycetota bacterium]